MYEWIKKIHMYAGLLSFTAFAVWGFTGIHAVFLPPPDRYEPPGVVSEREFPFAAPGDFDDDELARHIFETAAIPLAGGYYNLRRDEDGNLMFMSYTANGRRDFTYLEEQQLVRIEFRDNDLPNFFSYMHAAHPRRTPAFLTRLWGYYNEFSVWAFLFMALSGIYMWVATRPGLPWAQLCIGGVVIATLVLWLLTR